MVLSSTILISIHALREEGDVVPLDAQPVYLLFLSTPSARRATASRDVQSWNLIISIHALREEGDLSCFLRTWQCAGISIHALREEGDYSPPSQ